MEEVSESKFEPPLFKQRYEAVAQVINEIQAKSVLDMGCSEGKFLTYVKEKCASVEKIVGVDIDRSLLESTNHFIRPRPFEYIVKRTAPLIMSLYCGSIIQSDERFYDFDLISCIEVIEHLYDDILSKVPYNIFGVMKPKNVVITTPNCEYNQLFKDFSGLRHSDHKFEWTRNQFQLWCTHVKNTYGYSVKFSGVGLSPSDLNVGYCSQIAVFRRQDAYTKLPIELNFLEHLEELHTGNICHHGAENDGVCHRSINENIVPQCRRSNYCKPEVCHCRSPDSLDRRSPDSQLGKLEFDLSSNSNISNFSLIIQAEYPFDNVYLNSEQKILDEIGYNILLFFSNTDNQLEEVLEKQVPIDFFHSLSSIAKFNVSRRKLVSIIRQKFKVSEDDQFIIFNTTLPSLQRWYDDDKGDDELIEEEGNDPNTCFTHIEEEENWDAL